MHKIEARTLITFGAHDTMTAPVTETLQQNIPNSQLVQFQHSGHMTMIDNAELYDRSREMLLPGNV